MARVLRHGTTRRRAEAILRGGPDPTFQEPGGLDRAEGFSMAPVVGPYPFGSPEGVARGKARLFPQEGGAALVEIEVPDNIADLAADYGGEVRFEPGYGLDELIAAWPALPKRILSV